jgi:hypothetical protein
MDSVASKEREKAVTQADWLLRAWVLAAKHKFSCFLDDRPSPWVPRHARTALANAATELIVNATLRYQSADELPEDIRPLNLPMQGCLRGSPIAWVKDPRAGVWMPFWAKDEYVDVLPRLRPGQPAPPDLPARVLQGLALAEILVPPDYERRWRDRHDKRMPFVRSQFRSIGYVLLRDLIQPFQLGALRQHYRALISTGSVPKGDWIEQRYGLHSEMMATFLHLQMRELVSQMAGEPVKPSYVYFGSYREGAVLPRHTDRPQSEFSISLLVDYDPEPDGACGWPLYMENPRTPESTLAADLAMGDGVFYRGREVYHYRDACPEGHQATLLFLNYVPEGFTGRLW